ncbi:ligase-associated DNA damage response endonuclease PdeM [Aquimonas voraii]|uniref:Putative phosphoesterase n=1 Tax=Aquimonas voraii TaxID=265719 RepID=A0A1G6UBZ7_9GAMM|nr:ligase-associated DNA damage response endonuclease PdeM [Aquimonas voraii]SDD38898.1 putative phosphoesterase [Aquimonas voraii]
MRPDAGETGAMEGPSAGLAFGELRLELLPERAVHVPELSTLLLADLHLGKGDAFRRAGIALPAGGTAQDLARLSALIERHQPEQVIVLGDLIHGPLPSDAHWRQQWRDFLDRHAGRRFAAVLGNHDRALRGADEFEGVELLPEGSACGPLSLHHEPPECGLSAHASTAQARVLCGHLHPVLRLRQPGLPPRLPAFWLRQQRLTLPAFSAFTGGFTLQPKADEQVWLCAGDRVLALPGRTHSG